MYAILILKYIAKVEISIKRMFFLMRMTVKILREGGKYSHINQNLTEIQYV